MARIKQNVEPPDDVPVSPQWMKRGGYEETGRKATRGPLYRTPQACDECRRRGRAHECLVPSLRPAPDGPFFLCLPCTGCNGVWKSPCSFSLPGSAWRWDATRRAFAHERLNRPKDGDGQSNSKGTSRLGNKPDATGGGKKNSGSKTAPSRDPKTVPSRDPKAVPARKVKAVPAGNSKTVPARNLKTALSRDPKPEPKAFPPSRPLESGPSRETKAAPSSSKSGVKAKRNHAQPIPNHPPVIEILDSDSDSDAGSDDGDDIVINLRKRMAKKREDTPFGRPKSKRPRNDVAPLTAALLAGATTPGTNSPTVQPATEVTRQQGQESHHVTVKIEPNAFERPNGILATVPTATMKRGSRSVDGPNNIPSAPTAKPVPRHSSPPPAPGFFAAAPTISRSDEIMLLEAELEAMRDERNAALNELDAAIKARDKAKEERDKWVGMHTNLLSMFLENTQQGTGR